MTKAPLKKINLALQGGGAHGAFTWGVLSRLLQDEDIEIAAISGTSAGALNAAALKSGWIENGRAGAIENLDWLWGEVGAITDPIFAPWIAAAGPSADVWAKALANSPIYAALDMTTRLFSPYDFGAAMKNPLADIVQRFHYDAVCASDGPALHICATNVRSGKIRVFTGDEIMPEVIMASACLPSVFQAVEFEDPKTGKLEAFWDGGYTGNPALFPLFTNDLPDDILVVNINPLYRDSLPRDTQSIQNRINEISFNSSLLRELRAIEFVKKLLADGSVKPGTMKNVLVHMIADDDLMNSLNVATKTIPTAVILSRLKAAGEKAADTFLENHKADIGQRSSVDLTAMFS